MTLRRLIDLPGVRDLEHKALMKPRMGDIDARPEFPEIDETVRAALLPHGLSGTLWEANQVLEVHAGSAEVLP